MIEVIVSDNYSIDDTRHIFQEFSKKSDRVKFIMQTSNLGAAANFAEVLKLASGEYFMWLGDDDWIDASYVSHCVSLLKADQSLALVSGAPIYYQDGKKEYEGKLFDLSEESWDVRVANYYSNVTDNGMFYGIMRTSQLQKVSTSNAMGADWHLIANIVSIGKVVMCSEVAVHRDLGGATVSYRKIAKSLDLPMIQAVFPMTTIALGAAMNIVFTGTIYKKRSLTTRIILAGKVFIQVITRPIKSYDSKMKNLVKGSILLLIKSVSSK